MSRISARSCCTLPDVSKIEILGAQSEKIFVEFSMQELASLGLDRSALITALQAQNVVLPAGTIQTGYEALALRVSGAFRSEQDVREHQLRRRWPHAAPQRHCAGPARICRSAATDVSRQWPAGDRSRHRHARRGRHPHAGQDHPDAMVAEITNDLPLGITPTLVADQAVTVRSAIAEFMTSLWQAIAIILAVSFISLGRAAGPGHSARHSADACHRLLRHGARQHRHAAHIAGRAHHCARPAGRRCHDDHGRHARRASHKATTRCRPPPSRFAPTPSRCWPVRSSPLPASCRSVLPRARPANTRSPCLRSWASRSIVSWFVAVLFAPLLGVAILVPPDQPPSCRTRQGAPQSYRRFLTRPCSARWVTIPVTFALFVASFLALPLVPRQFFPSSDRPELLVDLSLPQNVSIFATETLARRFDAVLSRTTRTLRAGAPTWAEGAIRFYLPLNVQLPERFLCSGRDRGQGCGGTRAAARQAREAPGQRFSERGRPRLSPGARAAGRMARAIPRQRSRPRARYAKLRSSSPQVVATNPRRVHVNFDWIEPARQLRHPHRPGRSAPAGAELAGLASVLNTVMSGSTGHPGARRHLPCRCRRARHRRAARVARHPARPCRSRCRADARFRSASSPPSATSRSTRWCGVATACRR